MNKGVGGSRGGGKFTTTVPDHEETELTELIEGHAKGIVPKMEDIPYPYHIRHHRSAPIANTGAKEAKRESAQV